MTSRRRQPKQVAAALHRVVDGIAPHTTLARVQRHWAEVAGTALAREATPVSERAGVVTIACRSSVWAQELDMLSEPLVERLNAALGEPAVVRLRVVATAPA
jgi:predicted nucleic acid-binding Zn ribbon protein